MAIIKLTSKANPSITKNCNSEDLDVITRGGKWDIVTTDGSSARPQASGSNPLLEQRINILDSKVEKLTRNLEGIQETLIQIVSKEQRAKAPAPASKDK